MVVQVQLTDEELSQVKKFTSVENDAEAVARATREFLRLALLKQFKFVSGNVDYGENWHELEGLEFCELEFPT